MKRQPIIKEVSREVLYLTLRDKLEELFEKAFVVIDLDYKGLILDFAVISTDRLIEVCHVSSKEEYVRQMATIGRSGPVSFNKHKSIRDGKFITNAFYFLCPPRILTVDQIPPKYGLITYTADRLDFKQVADWIDPANYLTKSFYQTLAHKLSKKLYHK